MLIAGKILCTVRDLFPVMKCANTYLQLAPAGTPPLMLVNILLPDAATLEEVHRYVETVLAWREDPASASVEDFTTKVHSLLMPRTLRY
jgi:hypothetical protein